MLCQSYCRNNPKNHISKHSYYQSLSTFWTSSTRSIILLLSHCNSGLIVAENSNRATLRAIHGLWKLICLICNELTKGAAWEPNKEDGVHRNVTSWQFIMALVAWVVWRSSPTSIAPLSVNLPHSKRSVCWAGNAIDNGVSFGLRGKLGERETSSFPPVLTDIIWAKATPNRSSSL